MGAVGGATFWRADGIDLQHIRVEAIDKKGRVVPTANLDVTFTVESQPSKSPSPTGEGLGVRLVAVSSGDHYSDELTQLVNHRCLYEGRALAILRAGTTPATVTLTATAEDLKPAKLTLRTY